MLATWKRLGRHALLGSVLGLTGVVGGTWTLSAPAQEAPMKIRVKSRVFQLPLQIEDSYRPRIREVRLFMKEGQGDWEHKETVAPNVRSFRCQLPRDGEYSFSVVIVDHNGQAYPADVRQHPPAMVVVLDTQPPPVAREIPKPATKEIPFPETLNIVDSTTTISAASPDRMPLLKQLDPGPTVIIPATTPSSVPTVVEARESKDTKPASLPLPFATPMPKKELPATVPPAAPAGVPEAPAAAPTVTSAASPTLPIGSPMPPTGPALGAATPPKATARILESAQPQAPAPATQPSASSKRHPLVNNPRVGIEYNISKIGPSGIGRVDVWYTTDEGKSWQRLGEDPDRSSPAQVELPGEGVYGFRLVAVNGNGFGGRNPVGGDAPTSVVEVDVTAPVVHGLDVDPVDKSGALKLRWRVSDNNLPAEGVTLFYAAEPSGTWHPLVDKQKGEGHYQWTLPRDVAPQLYFRLEVTDLAGNSARHDTRMPVVLDTVQPDVNVLGITIVPQNGAKTTPSGN